MPDPDADALAFPAQSAKIPHPAAILKVAPLMRAITFPRIGRVLIALGRDAADVPITYTFRAQHAGQFQGLDG